MTPDKQAIRIYFTKLGLEPEIADIYLALHTFGPQTVSALARNSGVERTRIYRLIDQLLESGLIEVEAGNKRGILRPAPIANLRILISRREQELESLQDELTLIEQLLGRNQLASAASRVQFFQGMEGIKQMMWNETKAKSEILAILHENMQLQAGSKFFERWTDTCNTNGLQLRGVVGPDFIASQQAWYGQEVLERLQNWKQRRIAPEVFPITHTTITFDDVTAHYNWKGAEVFGIEIHNKDIAETQRRYFDMLWNKATP